MSTPSVSFLVQDTGRIFGAQRATLDLLAALRDFTGIQTHVWVMRETRRPDLAGDWRAALTAVCRNVEEFPVAAAYSRSLMRSLGNRAVESRISILHAIGPKADLHAVGARRHAPGLRLAATVHGWLFRKEWKERLHEAVDRWALGKMDAVVALSSFYQDYLQTRIRASVHRIPSGFDPEGLAALKTDRKGPLRVGYLGRYSEEKNLGMLLKAARMCPDPSKFQFLLAGEGPVRSALEGQAQVLGNVLVSGNQLREDFLSRIDVLVLCSHMENLPYSILEAMAVGLPVVATRVGGIPDLVRPEETGILVPPGDARALALALQSLEVEPEHARLLGQGGQRHLQQSFSPEACAKAHLALYQQLEGNA